MQKVKVHVGFGRDWLTETSIQYFISWGGHEHLVDSHLVYSFLQASAESMGLREYKVVIKFTVSYPPDLVFGTKATTNQIYDELAQPIVQAVMEGINGEQV